MNTRSSMPAGFTARILLTVVLFTLAIAPVARAAVTTVSYWRGGENDPGAFAGGFCSSTTDVIGGRTLQFAPSVFWDSMNVGASAAARVGSTLCLRAYGIESAGTNAAIPSLTDNFGLELWVNPSTLTGNQCLAYNGNTNSSGWGLYLIGNQYRGLFGGVGYVGTATATANTWTHLALVRDNGTATLYVNGVAAGTLGNAPVSPAGRFAIMGQPQNPALDRLFGFFDEVRVFTFAPGTFSTNDLLLFNSGLVTTTANAGPGSLRQAITDVNAGGLPGNITFTVTGTITLASDLPACTVPVNITGPGTNLLTVSGSNSFRLFQLAANTTNTIGGLTLANGYTANNNSGAALYNLGYTIVTNCLFTSNTVVGGFGGAVANFGTGTLLANNCTFANNSVSGGRGNDLAGYAGAGGGGGGMGGAIYTEGTTLTLSSCAFQNNRAAGGNGGNRVGVGSWSGSSGGYPNPGYGGGDSSSGGSGGFGGGGGGGGYSGNGGLGGFGGGGGGAGPGGFLRNGGNGGLYGGNGGPGEAFGGGGGGGAGLGGGVFASTGSVSVLNCAFTNNLATNGLAGTGYSPPAGNGQGVGGAIFVLDASLNLAGGAFSGNTASTTQPNLGGSTIVVNTNDSGGGSLRQAVLIANNDGSATTITFSPALSGQTITLTTGELLLTTSLTLTATNLAENVIISGGGASRITYIFNSPAITMNNLTLTGGNGVGALNSGVGGAIMMFNGSLTMTRCTLLGNSTSGSGSGGAIRAEGSLVLNQCTLSGNSAVGGGGAIYGDSLIANQCTLVGNSAPFSGGAIYNLGTATLNQCTLSGNSAGSQGGGVYSDGDEGAHLIFNNSIVSGNTAPNSPNIDGPSSGANNLVIANPLLAPLGNYGGRTKTMPPLPGSPAINGCVGGTSFTTDQRDQPRIVGTFADIGAVEGVFNPNFPLVNIAQFGSGNVQFGFTNLSGPTYRVLATTNVAAPLNTWTNLGAPLEAPVGTFTFTDLQATNYPHRFYRVTQP